MAGKPFGPVKAQKILEGRDEFAPPFGGSGVGDVQHRLGGPHPVIVTIRDNRDYVRVLLHLLKYRV